MANQPVDMGRDVPPDITLEPIDGLHRLYAAGSDGYIYSYSRARTNARKPCPFRLAECVNNNGYPHVSLIAGGKKSVAVHTLICRAFHGPKPAPTHEVRHLDGDRCNNRPENLCWGTPAENEADKRRHGRTALGEKHGAAKLTSEAVHILRFAIPRGLWNPTDAAEVFGVAPCTIRSVVRKKTWKSLL